MKSKFRYIYVLTLCSVTLIMSCVGTYKLRSNEFLDLYNRKPEFKPEAYVRQFHPDSAYVYVMFETNELLYKRADSQSPFTARLQVTASVQDMTPYSVADSVIYLFKDEQERLTDGSITGRFSITVRDTVNYQVRVDFKDLQSDQERTEYIFLKSYPEDPRYLDIKIEGEPRRHCACSQGQQVEFRPYYDVKEANWGSVEIERDAAPLPFSMTTNQAKPEKLISRLNPKNESDNWWSLACPEGNSIKLEFSDERTMLIPVFPREYPYMSSVESLVLPLRYITTNDEYDDLRFSIDKSKSVSAFWLGCAPDELRAKKLLSTYYKRVEEANIYFTDNWKEGWKTDRGLIYIAYGSPTRIIREPGKEVWYYNVENSDFGLQMHFIEGRRVKLDRSLDYRQSWYLAIDSWRNGKVSNL